MPEVGPDFLALSSHYERGRYGGETQLMGDARATALWQAIRRVRPKR